jgi:cytoskeletal protein CcmA (bactofilin family)
MNCFSEEILAIYVDGELPKARALEIEAHVALCPKCKSSVETLQVESRLLSSALEDSVTAPAWMASASWGWWELVRQAAPAAAVAVLLHYVFSWIGQQLPPATDWLNPTQLSGQSNLLFSLIFLLAKIGEAMVSQIYTIGTVLVCSILAALGGFLLWRHSKWLFRPGIGIVMLFVLVMPGFSMEKRIDKKGTVTVAANETVDDSLLATGDTVFVEGTVNGDLIAFGRRVEIRGEVKGNLMTGAQTVEVRGKVGGNIYATAQGFDLGGQVSHNVYAWCQSLRVSPEASVGGDIVAGAGDIIIEGHILRSVIAFAGTLDSRADIGRDLNFFGGQVRLTGPARVGGNFRAEVAHKNDVHIASEATVTGKTETHISISKAQNRYTQPRFYFWQLVWLLGAMLVGWILLVLFPGFFHGTVNAVSAGWRSLALGFAVLVGVPVALIILCITLVGVPLALVVTAVYLSGLYLAKIFVGALLGRVIMKFASPTLGQSVLALLIGLVILTILFHIPFYIGVLAHFAVLCFGLGAFAWQVFRTARPVSG